MTLADVNHSKQRENDRRLATARPTTDTDLLTNVRAWISQHSDITWSVLMHSTLHHLCHHFEAVCKPTTFISLKFWLAVQWQQCLLFLFLIYHYVVLSTVHLYCFNPGAKTITMVQWCVKTSFNRWQHVCVPWWRNPNVMHTQLFPLFNVIFNFADIHNNCQRKTQSMSILSNHATCYIKDHYVRSGEKNNITQDNTITADHL